MTSAQLQFDKPFYKRLRERTAIGGAVIFLIPFLLFTLLVQFASDRYVRRQFNDRLRAGVATNAALLDDVFSKRQREVQWLARAVAEDRLLPSSSTQPLQNFVNGHPWYGFIVIADTSGAVLRSSNALQGNVGPCGCLDRALAGETIITDVFHSPLTQRDEMFIVSPMAGQPQRLLFVQFDRATLTSRFLDLGIGATENTFLVSPAGELVSPMRRGTLRAQGLAFASGSPNPFAGERGTAEYRSASGADVLAAYQKLSSKNYFLVTQVDASEMDAPSRKLRSEVMFYVLPFLLLGVLLAVFAWRYAMDYIQRLMTQLYKALGVATQREAERDVALQELGMRFEKEKELARQRAEFQAQLAEYEKYAALAQLALGAAHEINNPLLGILSHLELELRKTQDPERRDEIQQCIEGSRRIAATLRGLINYARPGPLQLTRVNIRQMVEDSLAFLTHQPLFRNIALENNVPADLPALHADANQLSQVLMNLLLNAGQAMPNGGRIAISAARNGDDRIEISVADNGTGIPQDVLPHIFEPFFTTKRGKGTGLGLSISQAYIRSHGGDIEIHTVPDEGTTVRITMPLQQEVRAEPQAQEVIG
jgi:signal transduction histidine kinase